MDLSKSRPLIWMLPGKNLLNGVQDLGSSQDMSEVLEACFGLGPEILRQFESGLHARVRQLGTAKLGRRRTVFTAAVWRNIAKVVLIIDSFRCMSDILTVAHVCNTFQQYAAA